MIAAARSASDAVEAARDLVPLLRANAAAVDAEAAFPAENLEALRSSGLLGLMVPVEAGGLGGTSATLAAVCRVLGEGCMSTALIYGMHCQQVGVVADHADASLRARVLDPIGAGGLYVASVTSERGKGGHLLTAQAPLAPAGDGWRLERDAPVVTGGAHADAFLVTMRRDPDAPPSEVALVWAKRSELEVEVTSGWDPLGARGTHSVGLRLTGEVPADHVVGDRFHDVAVSSMIPLGHIAWAASWLGAATGVYREMVGLFRDPASRRGFDVTSDLFATHLARIRMQLSTVSAFLASTVAAYERIRGLAGTSPAPYEEPAFQLQINDLKVLASETLFSGVDRLLELSGLRYGYMRTAPVPLERVFRDLRSASLMYANERLLIANGKLALLDRDVTLAGS